MNKLIPNYKKIPSIIIKKKIKGIKNIKKKIFKEILLNYKVNIPINLNLKIFHKKVKDLLQIIIQKIERNQKIF